jgi:hypothetical protein
MKTAYALPNPQSSSSVANFGAINCTTMKRHFTFGLFFCLACTISFGQVVLNSGFTSGTANWGCTPETNPESVYGGPTANTVAEIDVLVGLCQTINGLVPGTVYNLNYVASRRLGGCPGPNPATIGVTIANLNTTDSRTNTVLALSPSTFLFTATATSHTLNIFHQFVVNTTCGFIIDDITVTVAVPFPVTLTNFDVTESVNGQANIIWTTAEEADALTFVVTKSLDLQQWLPVAEIPAMGNARSYEVQDWPTAGDMTYYRLQGIDANGQVQDLGTRSILVRKITKPVVSPNPCTVHCCIDFPGIGDGSIWLIDGLGRMVQPAFSLLQENRICLDLRGCLPGIYSLRILVDGKDFVCRVVLVGG